LFYAPYGFPVAESRLRNEVREWEDLGEHRNPSGGSGAVIALALRGRFDAAIESLRARLELGADAADLESDLSALLLERGIERHYATDLVEALDHAKRALSMDPAREEALFNRALADERLGLDTLAFVAWGKAAQGPQSDGFVDEALDHRETLGRLRSTVAAQGNLAALDPSDSAQAVVSDRLAVRAYRDGVEGLKRFDLARAARFFEVSRQRLGETELARWAEYQLAVTAYQRVDYAAAERALLALSNKLANRPAGLAGRTEWMLGLIAALRDQPEMALTRLQKAKGLLEKAGDGEASLGVRRLSATVLGELGESERAWSELLPTLGPAESGRARWTAFEAGWRLAGRFEHPLAAVDFRDELLWEAKRNGEPAAIAVALAKRADGLASDRLYEAAEHSIGQAMAFADQSGAQRLERSLNCDLERLRGSRLVALDPRAALKHLEHAVSDCESDGNQVLLASTLTFRAAAYRELGQLDTSAADARRALVAIEAARSTISKQANLESFLDAARGAIEESVRIQALRGDPDAALAAAEQGRARVLWEDLTNLRQSGNVLSAPSESDFHVSSELRSHLRDGTALIEYLLGRDELFIWVINRERTILRTVLAPAREVRAEVNRWRHAIAFEDDAAIGAAGSRLSGWLLAPIASEVSGTHRLLIVPDGPLSSISFAALPEPRTQRALVDTKEIVFEPSARIALATRRESFAKRQPIWHGLIVTGVGSGSELPGVELEARAMSTQLACVERVVGSSVSKGELLGRAGGFEIVHFAGHAVVNAEDASKSHLLLLRAPGEEPIRLFASELEGRRFPRTRLVVLSGCGSALGPASSSEGVASLGRALLRAGVPAVIASLWDVGDRDAAEFFSPFYAALASGVQAEAALRQAQLAIRARHKSQKPSTQIWGAFVVLGTEPPNNHRRR
jgi:CHAT domain-containing protein